MRTRLAGLAHPLYGLADGELELVTQFVLSSGSLKELAHQYGCSYPTIRTRLDILIDRLQHLIADFDADRVPALIDDLLARGEVTPPAALALLEAHRLELRKHGLDDLDEPA